MLQTVAVLLRFEDELQRHEIVHEERPDLGDVAVEGRIGDPELRLEVQHVDLLSASKPLVHKEDDLCFSQSHKMASENHNSYCPGMFWYLPAQPL